jgi:HK97 family phage major capsid protein
MTGSLADIREERAAKQKFLHEVFEQAGPEVDMSKVTLIDGDTARKAAEIKRLNDELTGLGVEMDRLEHLETIKKLNESEYRRNNDVSSQVPYFGNGAGSGGGSPNSGMHAAAQKGLKAFLQDHKGYREFRASQASRVDIQIPVADFKTLVTLTTISPQNFRRPDLVPLALEERTVTDLMLESGVDRGTVEYYEETTFTNAAATVAEGITKAESALGYTLRNEPVRKIAHFIPATKEALDDVSFLEGQIRGRLAFGVRRIEETQVLTGNGTGTNLLGIVNRTGIQTQAKGTDPNPDAVYKAMQKIRGSAGVFHPADWTLIKLLRTADGIYIWGNPSDEGPDRIWGMMVRQTTGMTQGTALVGAFRPHAEVLRREGITVTLSTEHSTFFTDNKVAILAESRLGLACYRPSAFATVTGIV